MHWQEYGAELIGTAILVFVGLSAVVFNFAQGLPMEQLIPSKSIRLLLTGLMFSGTGSLVAISPLGHPSLPLYFQKRQSSTSNNQQPHLNYGESLWLITQKFG